MPELEGFFFPEEVSAVQILQQVDATNTSQ